MGQQLPQLVIVQLTELPLFMSFDCMKSPQLHSLLIGYVSFQVSHKLAVHFDAIETEIQAGLTKFAGSQVQRDPLYVVNFRVIKEHFEPTPESATLDSQFAHYALS